MRSISNEIVQMDVYDERGDLKEGIFYDGLIDYLVDNYGLTDAEANAILGAARTSIMISSAASAADREKEELLALEEIKTLINNGAVSDYDSLNNWIKIYGLEFNAKYIEQLNGHLGDKLDADAKAEARKLASVNFDVLLLIENGSIMSETLLEAAIDVNGLKGTQYEQTLYDRFDEISLQRSIDDDTKNANEMADMWIDSYDGENMEEIKDALYDLYGDTYSETAIEKAASIIASVYGVGENSRENAAEQTLEDANFTVLAMIEEGSISSTYLLDAAITKWNLDGTEYEQELREKFETIQQENTQTEYTRQLNTWMDAAGNGNLSVSQRDQILGMRESGELSEDDFKKITEAYSSSVRAELSSGYVFADEYGDWMLGSDAKIMVEEALKDKFLSEDVKKTLVKKYNDKYAIYKCVYWNNGNPQPWGTSGDPASGKFELHHGDDKYLLTAGDVVNDEDILVAAGDLDNMTVFMKDNVLYVKGKAGEVYKCNNAGYIPGSTPGFNITNQFIDAVNNVTGNLTQIITDPKYYTGVTYG